MSLLSILDRSHTLAPEVTAAGSSLPPRSRSTSPSAKLTPSASSTFPCPRSSASTSPRQPTGSSPDRLDLQHRHRLSRTLGAVLGRWLEEVGPRKAMFCAAVCFAGGFFVAALGVSLHQIWIVYLGYGVHRRHRPRARLHLAGLDAHQMVSGSAGNGDWHRDHGLRRRRDDRFAALGRADGTFPTPTHVGVAETFVVMGSSTSSS